MTVTVRLPAGMVAVLVLDALPLLSVPLQLPTLQPEDGVAVRWIDAPAVYWPAVQPAELAGEGEGSPPEPEWATESA